MPTATHYPLLLVPLLPTTATTIHHYPLLHTATCCYLLLPTATHRYILLPTATTATHHYPLLLLPLLTTAPHSPLLLVPLLPTTTTATTATQCYSLLLAATHCYPLPTHHYHCYTLLHTVVLGGPTCCGSYRRYQFASVEVTTWIVQPKQSAAARSVSSSPHVRLRDIYSM